MSTSEVAPSAPTVPARLLPTALPVLPAVTRRKLGRLAGGYGLLWLLGVATAGLGRGPVAVVGAGLLLPGGGHLAHGQVLHAALALAAFGLSLLVWWMVGAVVVPVSVWAVLAVEGAWTHPHAPGPTVWLVVTAGLVPVAAALALGVHALRHHRQVGVARMLNRELATVRFPDPAAPPSAAPPVGEATPDDLAHLRLALDLALQPLDGFAGFDRRDQFREAALRYQLCVLGYALSTFRYTHTPAFSGYLGEAQERALLKMGDRRVWGYWALENAWGRLSVRRDPVDNRDNVMLTGWQGVAAGMFESLEDDRFSRPGALTYVWSDEERYAHDFPALAASIHRNMRRSPYTLFSCEPRWIYPVCNTFGVNTLVLHDRLHGTDYLPELRDAIAHAYEHEFQRPDGKRVGVRNENLGLSWNIWASEGVSLPTTFWMHAFLPDQAQRAWWLLRRTVLRHDGERHLLPRTAANRCDIGSYRFGSDAFAQTFLAMTARELGDTEVADGAFAYVDATQRVERRDGVARYADLSTQGNLYSLIARFSRPSGTRELIGVGPPAAWRRGPRLAQAAYPEALVARAVSDGEDLDLVLHPGAGATRTTIVVDRLRPGRSYRLHGATEPGVEAGPDGRAIVQVDLGGRTAVRVEPTA